MFLLLLLFGCCFIVFSLLLLLLLLLLPSNLRVGVECDFRKLTAIVADGAVVVVVGELQ